MFDPTPPDHSLSLRTAALTQGDDRMLQAHPPLKPILIVLHQPQSTPAHIGQSLVRMGYTLDIRRPRFGDPLPTTMAHHDGAVIFGGPMSANDPDDYIKAEIDWINVPLSENKPFLGICLGAQMFARLLGATVRFGQRGFVVLGVDREFRAVDPHDLLAGIKRDAGERVGRQRHDAAYCITLSSSTSNWSGASGGIGPPGVPSLP